MHSPRGQLAPGALETVEVFPLGDGNWNIYLEPLNPLVIGFGGCNINFQALPRP